MSDHKQEQPLLPHTIDYSNPEEQKKIVSDHLMQIAEDKNLGITLGTFNTAWSGDLAIGDSGKQGAPRIFENLDRVSRCVEFLAKTKDQNPGLSVIALQESASTPTDHKSASTIKAIEQLKEDLDRCKTVQERNDVKTRIEKLQFGNLVWDQANLNTHLSSWNAVTEPATEPHSPYKTILYDKTRLKEVKTNFKFEGLSPDLKNGIQAIELQENGGAGKSFIVYNVHFPHHNEPSNTDQYISQILALPHNKKKTVYIMGDFNARLPSTEPKTVNNGTCVVPWRFRLLGKRCYDATDAFFKQEPNSNSADRLKTKIVDFKTGEATDLPEVSLETAEKDPYFFPVPRPGDHLIKCADGQIQTGQDLIASTQKALEIDEKKTSTQNTLIHSKVFLEKNICNLPRIVINALHLTQQQTSALHDLEVTFFGEDGFDDPAGQLSIPRFVLYPHKENDWLILQSLKTLLAPIEAKQRAESPEQQAAPKHAQIYSRPYLNKLKKIAKIIALIAVLPAITAAFLFGFSVAFVPAVFLSIAAGVLGTAAGIIHALTKHRAKHPYNDKPLAYRYLAIGSLIAIGAGFVMGFAPSVVFLGIAAAPAMLAFAVAGLFMLAAAVIAWGSQSNTEADDRMELSMSRSHQDGEEAEFYAERSYGNAPYKDPLLGTHTRYGTDQAHPRTASENTVPSSAMAAAIRVGDTLHKNVRDSRRRNSDSDIEIDQDRRQTLGRGTAPGNGSDSE